MNFLGLYWNETDIQIRTNTGKWDDYLSSMQSGSFGDYFEDFENVWKLCKFREFYGTFWDFQFWEFLGVPWQLLEVFWNFSRLWELITFIYALCKILKMYEYFSFIYLLVPMSTQSTSPCFLFYHSLSFFFLFFSFFYFLFQ